MLYWKIWLDLNTQSSSVFFFSQNDLSYCFRSFFPPAWLLAVPTTMSCKERFPSWKNATCECFFLNWTSVFQDFLLLQFVRTFDFSDSENTFSLSAFILFLWNLFLSLSLCSLWVSFFLLSFCRSLMEQLRRLQALVMNSSNKPVQTGTCVLVCLLSKLASINVHSKDMWTEKQLFRLKENAPYKQKSICPQ